jgi:hypothetical protein
MEEGISSANRKVYFRVKVADALVYYDQNNYQKYTDILCEIEITNYVIEIYNELKENDRVRFYNLKGYPKYGKNFKYYDHSTGRTITHYLYLQCLKNTTFQNLSSIKSLKEEVTKCKEYAKANLPSSYLLSSIDLEDPNLFSFYQKDLRLYNNEIDIVAVILESDHQKAYGYVSSGHLFKLLVHI